MTRPSAPASQPNAASVSPGGAGCVPPADHFPPWNTHVALVARPPIRPPKNTTELVVSSYAIAAPRAGGGPDVATRFQFLPSNDQVSARRVESLGIPTRTSPPRSVS